MEYKSEPNLELRWEQVVCKRSVAGDVFDGGVQDFEFGVSGKNAWIPAHSYFRMEFSLKHKPGLGPAVPITLNHGVTYADDAIGCAYNNVYVRAGGQDLSNQIQYLPQGSAIKCRLNSSGAFLDYVGKEAYLCDADVHSRINKLAAGGDTGTSPAVELVPRAAGDYTDIVTYAYAGGAATLTRSNGAGPNSDFTTMGVRPGDIINVGGVNYPIASVTNANVLIVGVAGIIGFDTADWHVVRGPENRNKPYNNKDTIFGLWQPPVGIFDINQPLSGGHFSVQLNPEGRYKTAMIESLSGVGAIPAADTASYELVIKNVYFYIALVKKNMPPTGTFNLALSEMNILTKTLATTANTQFLDFTVPPSTYALTIFVQATSAGTTTFLPPTRFKSVDLATGKPDNKEQDLRQIQVSYGSVTKPATLYESSYNNQDDRMMQRWISTHMHIGDLHKTGAGFETYQDWLKRGPYIHMDFSRDKNDTSTQAKVQIEYGTAFTTPMQLFLVAHYSRSISIDYDQGHIQQVTSVNR